MTTRFSIAELSDMLQTPVAYIRIAIEELSRSDALTAESFIYAERNWRVAPSDVKRIQAWLAEAQTAGNLPSLQERRIVKRKRVISNPTE